MSPEIQTTRLALPSGVTLKYAFGGEGEALIFLHGFPESHLTWRHQLTSLAHEYRVVAPDQRGYGGSDKPADVADYRTDRLVADVLALADTLDIERFTLVGHDFGGATGWSAALRHPDRIQRLVVVNAPHPLLFQRSLIEDEAQRAASQYIRAFQTPGMERVIRAMGPEAFFDHSIGALLDDPRMISPMMRSAYIADWARPGAIEAMLNWYRAADLTVPESGEKAHYPLWTHLPFPRVKVPVLVIWGMKDKALLPVQLEGLDSLVPDLQLVTEGAGGHFLPWERPEVVTGAIRRFLTVRLDE